MISPARGSVEKALRQHLDPSRWIKKYIEHKTVNSRKHKISQNEK